MAIFLKDNVKNTLYSRQTSFPAGDEKWVEANGVKDIRPETRPTENLLNHLIQTIQDGVKYWRLI